MNGVDPYGDWNPFKVAWNYWEREWNREYPYRKTGPITQPKEGHSGWLSLPKGGEQAPPMQSGANVFFALAAITVVGGIALFKAPAILGLLWAAAIHPYTHTLMAILYFSQIKSQEDVDLWLPLMIPGSSLALPLQFLARWIGPWIQRVLQLFRGRPKPPRSSKGPRGELGAPTAPAGNVGPENVRGLRELLADTKTEGSNCVTSALAVWRFLRTGKFQRAESVQGLTTGKTLEGALVAENRLALWEPVGGGFSAIQSVNLPAGHSGFIALSKSAPAQGEIGHVFNVMNYGNRIHTIDVTEGIASAANATAVDDLISQGYRMWFMSGGKMSDDVLNVLGRTRTR